MDDGLPGMEVYDIKQDRKGYIWIATSKGVSRFDGNRYENFNVENGLPDNEILRISEDARGRIWFISLTGAWTYYDGSIHNSNNTSFLKNNLFQLPVRSFAPLSNGDILFCNQNHPTYSLTDTTVKVFSSSSHYSIFERKDNSLLMVDNTNDCIIQWKNKNQVKQLKVNYQTDYDKCEYNKFSDLLLMANESGLSYFLKDKLYHIDDSLFYKRMQVKFLTSDKEGYFWLSVNDGCYRFKIDVNQNKLLKQKYFEGYVVNFVFEDADNNFWIATRGEGLLFCPSLKVKLFNKSSGLADNNLTAALKTKDGKIICGTLNGYVHTISSDNKIIETQNLQSLRVQKIINDNKGVVWIGCERNIFKKEKLYLNISLNPSASFKTIAKANDGGVWIGGHSRVDKIIDNKAFNILRPKDIIRFYSVCESGDNTLWLGTEKGLYTYKDSLLKAFEHFRKPFTGWIDAICKTKSGNLLITTRDSGLAILNKVNVSFINASDGLQSNSCVALFADTGTGKVYVGTKTGLSIINFTDDNAFAINNYNASNGLQCGSIYSIYESAGEILLCTDRGLMTFTESDLHTAYENAKVFLQKVEINSKEVALDSNYTLQHDENNIKITYNGTAYRNPKSLMYRYKLSPIDTGWNTTFSNTIIYSDLSPGSYHFIVEVRKGGFQWNSNSSSFRFEIAKPYWQTWWFRFIMAFIIVSILFYVYRFRMNQSKSKHEIETTLLQTELKALRAQINPHFIFNSLNSIQDFIFNNQKEEANEYLGKFAKLMRMILDNSSKKYISLAEEISFLKIYLQLESLRFADKFTYEISINENVNVESCYLPPMILQLYVENAILHGLAQKQGDGKLKVDFNLSGNIESNDLICIIEDNGIGRKKSAEQKKNAALSNYKSHGLENTNERIEAINKTSIRKIVYQITDIENQVATGTRIQISFPQDTITMNKETN